MWTLATMLWVWLVALVTKLEGSFFEMVKWLLRLWFIGVIFLTFSVANVQAQGELEFETGMLFPDLVVVKFFSTLMEHDLRAMDRLFLENKAVNFVINGEKYEGLPEIRAYIQHWLSLEKVDLFVQIDSIEVRSRTANVGGGIKGELLDLTTGLSKHVIWEVDGTLGPCGEREEHWCLRELVVSEREN